MGDGAFVTWRQNRDTPRMVYEDDQGRFIARFAAMEDARVACEAFNGWGRMRGERDEARAELEACKNWNTSGHKALNVVMAERENWKETAKSVRRESNDAKGELAEARAELAEARKAIEVRDRAMNDAIDENEIQREQIAKLKDERDEARAELVKVKRNSCDIKRLELSEAQYRSMENRLKAQVAEARAESDSHRQQKDRALTLRHEWFEELQLVKRLVDEAKAELARFASPFESVGDAWDAWAGDLHRMEADRDEWKAKAKSRGNILAALLGGDSDDA